MNFRVADIEACYQLWSSRGAEFITEPIPKYGETRCYIAIPMVISSRSAEHRAKVRLTFGCESHLDRFSRITRSVLYLQTNGKEAEPRLAQGDNAKRR